jgi:hypothetical protein
MTRSSARFSGVPSASQAFANASPSATNVAADFSVARPVGNSRGSVRGPAMPSTFTFPPWFSCSLATPWAIAASGMPVAGVLTSSWICLMTSAV